MKALLASLPLIAAAPLAAEPTTEQAEVIAAAEAFFAALRSDDKTGLAGVMLPEGMIFVHSRMKPDLARVDAVLVDGDMAQLWNPYRFIAEVLTSHCGINALSLVKTENGWKVANTSFTMELPERCAALGAPEAPAQ